MLKQLAFSESINKEIEKVIEILKEAQRELSFNKDISRSIYGIDIDILMKNKKIPVKNYCLNFSLYILKKLQENNISGKMILAYKNDKTLHFMLKVLIEGQKFFIDIHYGRILFLKDIQQGYRIIFESNIYSGEKNIKELFANTKIFGIGLYIRNIIYNLIEEKKINKGDILERRETFFNTKFYKDIQIIG